MEVKRLYLQACDEVKKYRGESKPKECKDMQEG